MGSNAVRLTCICDREFVSDNEHDAWGLLQRHIADMAAMDETLHGLASIEAHEVVKTAADPMDKQEEIEVRRMDLIASMSRRNFGTDWTEQDEQQFLRDLPRWMAITTHEAYHDNEHPDWMQCRRSTCLIAALAMPENRKGIDVD